MTDILAGNSPGANVPAESVLALIEQGLQVYSAVHKRIHRAQYKEFKKIKRLNALYLDQMTYGLVLDDQQAIVQADFSSSDFDIEPVSDPNATTMVQRLLKAKALLDLRGQGLDDKEILRRYLIALDIEDIDAFFPEESEGGKPEEQMAMQKMQLDLEELSAKIEKLKAETEKIRAEIPGAEVKQAKDAAGIAYDQRKLDIEEASVANQIELGRSQMSIGKAPGGITESTAKREYGLETNNQRAGA
jgi:chaperonin GroES